MSDLSTLSSAELMKAERAIARRHIGKFPYFAVTWAIVNLAVWLTLFPLVMSGLVPLWAGFFIATLNIALCYLPSHEAQHDIIARPGSKLFWLNETIGHLSLVPFVLPYRIAKLTHLEHHKHANDPELDPDYPTHGRGPLHAAWKSIQYRQPGKMVVYANALTRLGRADLAIDFVIYEIVYYGTLIAMAWSGFALEAALLWWLPRHIALTYIQLVLSWAPHHPADEMGRYRDTRSFRSVLGNIGTMSMQYHIIHHLHPRIPLCRTPRAYWEMRDILKARGARIEAL